MWEHEGILVEGSFAIKTELLHCNHEHVFNYVVRVELTHLLHTHFNL